LKYRLGLTLLQIARQGSYNQGLSMLLDSGTWRGITLADYGVWASEVWHILALKAVRRYSLFNLVLYLQVFILSPSGDKIFCIRTTYYQGVLKRICQELM
jgi:hypothetical protein